MKFGNVSINSQAAKAMGEQDFKAMFKGVIPVDIDYAWNIINEGQVIDVPNIDIKPIKVKRKRSESNESPTSEME